MRPRVWKRNVVEGAALAAGQHNSGPLASGPRRPAAGLQAGQAVLNPHFFFLEAVLERVHGHLCLEERGPERLSGSERPEQLEFLLPPGLCPLPTLPRNIRC